MSAQFSPKSTEKKLKTKSGQATFYQLSALESLKVGSIASLPFSIKILLESAVRNYDGYQVTFQDIQNLLSWPPVLNAGKEIAFKPGRVILQDFTGVPCIVDLAAMRSAMKQL